MSKIPDLEKLLARHRNCLDDQLREGRQYVALEVTSNASGKHGLLDTRQKIQLCRHFSRDRLKCQRGSTGFNDTDCSFSHGPLDIWQRLTLSNEVQDGKCSRPTWALNDPDFLWWLLKHFFSTAHAEMHNLFKQICENLAGKLDQGTCPICYDRLEEHLSLCFHHDAEPDQPQYHHRVCKATCAKLFLDSWDRLGGDCLCPLCRIQIHKFALKLELALATEEDLNENHKGLWGCLRSAAETFILIWNVETEISKLRNSQEAKRERSKQAKSRSQLQAKLELMKPQQDFTPPPLPTSRTSSESRTSHEKPKKSCKEPRPPSTMQSAASASSQQQDEQGEDSTTGSRGNADSRSSSSNEGGIRASDSSSCSADATYDRNFLLAVKLQNLTAVSVPPGLAVLAARNPPEDAPSNQLVDSINVESRGDRSDSTGSSSRDASIASQSSPNFTHEEGKSSPDTSSSITESPAAALHTADITLQSLTPVQHPAGLPVSLQSMPAAVEASTCTTVHVTYGMACHPNERFQIICSAEPQALTQLLVDLRTHPKLDPNGMIKCVASDGQQWLCVNSGKELLPHISNGKLELRCHRHMDASQRLGEMKQLTLELKDALDLGQASHRTLIEATLQSMSSGGHQLPLGLSMLEQLEWALHLVLG